MQSPFTVLEVMMSAIGGDVTVNSITFTKLGADRAPDGELIIYDANREVGRSSFSSGIATLSFSYDIREGETKRLSVMLNAPLVGVGLGVEISSATKIVANSNKDCIVTLETLEAETGCGNVVMLGEPVSGIVIDGSFEDWAGILSNEANETKKDVKNKNGGRVENANLDIVDYKSCADFENVSMYVRVDGSMLGGANIPARFAPFVPSGAPACETQIMPKVEGVDIVYFLLDVDGNRNTGYRADVSVGVDYIVEVKGRLGKILPGSSVLKRFSGSSSNEFSFDTIVSEVSSAKGEKEIEVQIKKSGISFGSTFSILYWVCGWDGKDESDHVVNMVDPVQLTGAGSTYLSADGNTWIQGVSGSSSGFVDMCTDINGYIYAVKNTGETWRSTDGGKSFEGTAFVSAITAVTDVVAITADDQTTPMLFIVRLTGRLYSTTGGTWTDTTRDFGNTNDYIDMSWVPGAGSGTNSDLYVVRSARNVQVLRTVDLGAPGGFGANTPGGGGTIYVAIVAYSSTTFYLLQSDGDLVYTTNTGGTYTTFGSKPPSGSGTYVDMAQDRNTGGYIS